jgi:hypothetical protein
MPASAYKEYMKGEELDGWAPEVAVKFNLQFGAPLMVKSVVPDPAFLCSCGTADRNGESPRRHVPSCVLLIYHPQLLTIVTDRELEVEFNGSLVI